MLILSPFDRRKPVRDLKGVEPQDQAFERADDRVNAQRRSAIDDPNDSGVLAEPVELGHEFASGLLTLVVAWFAASAAASNASRFGAGTGSMGISAANSLSARRGSPPSSVNSFALTGTQQGPSA
jgi:hypothetical protein